ncbi:MAG: hypothetical protein KIS73_23865 [Enhydrobacter sp.]|nr:hypothetical protein [Enhydrobacter sp.]
MAIHAFDATVSVGEPHFASMSDRASVLDALSLAHEVASGNAGWPSLAAKLSDLLGGERVVLFMLDARTEAAKLLASSTPNLDKVPERFLQAGRRQARRLKARLPSSRLVGSNHARSKADTVGDLATWRMFLEPDGAFVKGHLLGTSEATYLCLACGPDAPGSAVEPKDREFVEAVVRLLARAVEISARIDSMSAQLHATSQILDRSAVGIIQLDRNGAVLELNGAALRIAQAGDGLTITTAGVHAATEADEVHLQDAIARAIANRSGDYVHRFSIRRRSGLPTGVVLTSIDRAHHAVADQTCCVLFVIDSEARHDPDPSAIADLLGLTPAQARVVAALTAGKSLAEVAACLGVTVNTARTLLSRAMAKTGTNSQVALVRLVLTAVIPLPASE